MLSALVLHVFARALSAHLASLSVVFLALYVCLTLELSRSARAVLWESGVRVFALLFQAGCVGARCEGRRALPACRSTATYLFWQPRLCLTFITLYLKESAHMRMQASPTHVVCNHKK